MGERLGGRGSYAAEVVSHLGPAFDGGGGSEGYEQEWCPSSSPRQQTEVLKVFVFLNC